MEEKESIGIYIDFDNLYGGILTNLNIEATSPEITEESKSNLVEAIRKIPTILSSLFERHHISFIKAFAEYENIPHNKIYRPSLQTFLYNIGIKPINPFIHYSHKSGKSKNASDITLTLEVATDLQIKNIPINSVCIFTGDIDLYPLIYWIKEHTNKNIYILAFDSKLNKTYRNLELLSVKVLPIDEKFKEIILNQIENKDAFINKCSQFKENFLTGLENWFKKGNQYLSTGLLINNWFPRWQLNITEEEANSCLKELLSSGIIEELGYRFILEDSQTEGMVKGKIVRA